MLYHLNVKTTTYPMRHYEALKKARDIAELKGMSDLSILQVGPGMALRGIGNYNGVGKFRIIKRIETGLRRLPLPKSLYRTFETPEILMAFEGLNPSLHVADISQKSVDVVKSSVHHDKLTAARLDLCTQDEAVLGELTGQFDVIVCLATVKRVGNSEKVRLAKSNLNRFARERCIMVTEADMTDFGFTRQPSSTIYVR